jgi:peptide chain release factor 2
MQELINKLEALKTQIASLIKGVNLPQMKETLAELQKQAEAPDLWDDPQSAQRLMKEISDLNSDVDTWEKLTKQIDDTLELAQMGEEEFKEEIEADVDALSKVVQKKEMDTLLSGEYDKGDALLSINAGAGGTDSQDWAFMLQRMYLRWIENHGFKGEILEVTPGEEAGIKSCTIAVNGRYAYGYLRAEKGVHRLVRLSPFDSQNRRHTSFALIEVLPQVDEDHDIDINPTELKIETFRAGGAGGQNVQKNDTAIRITHIPSGIVASCQNERSQTQNKDNAMKVLKSRLLEIKMREQEQAMNSLRGEFQKIEWGSQIRSYVLHPYQMVKDHRTNFESGNTQGVLDGDLDGFIESYLRYKVANDL